MQKVKYAVSPLSSQPVIPQDPIPLLKDHFNHKFSTLKSGRLSDPFSQLSFMMILGQVKYRFQKLFSPVAIACILSSLN